MNKDLGIWLWQFSGDDKRQFSYSLCTSHFIVEIRLET